LDGNSRTPSRNAPRTPRRSAQNDGTAPGRERSAPDDEDDRCPAHPGQKIKKWAREEQRTISRGGQQNPGKNSPRFLKKTSTFVDVKSRPRAPQFQTREECPPKFEPPRVLRIKSRTHPRARSRGKSMKESIFSFSRRTTSLSGAGPKTGIFDGGQLAPAARSPIVKRIP